MQFSSHHPSPSNAGRTFGKIDLLIEAASLVEAVYPEAEGKRKLENHALGEIKVASLPKSGLGMRREPRLPDKQNTYSAPRFKPGKARPRTDTNWIDPSLVLRTGKAMVGGFEYTLKNDNKSTISLWCKARSGRSKGCTASTVVHKTTGKTTLRGEHVAGCYGRCKVTMEGRRRDTLKLMRLRAAWEKHIRNILTRRTSTGETTQMRSANSVVRQDSSANVPAVAVRVKTLGQERTVSGAAALPLTSIGVEECRSASTLGGVKTSAVSARATKTTSKSSTVEVEAKDGNSNRSFHAFGIPRQDKQCDRVQLQTRVEEAHVPYPSSLFYDDEVVKAGIVKVAKAIKRRGQPKSGGPKGELLQSRKVEKPVELGSVGFSFRKLFDAGWFDGVVSEIRLGSGESKHGCLLFPF
jgi:hypothetical protein